MPDAGHKETDNVLSQLEKKLKTTYRAAARNAQSRFTQYMADFSRKDAEHKAEVTSGKWTQEQYENWRKNQLLYADTLKQIKQTIASDLQNTDKIAMQMVRDKQPDVYAINYNYGTYEIEKGAGVDTTFTLYDHDTVERLIKDEPKLLPKPSKKRQAEIDASDLKWNMDKLTSAFTSSILSGDDIATMAKRISGVAAMDWKAAVRNARTMTTGAENAGRSNAYKRAQGMGIDVMQEWVATLDGRTRDSHRAVDGEKIKIGGRFSNGLRYPGDPDGPGYEVYNCRCTTVAVVNGIDPMAFDKTDTLRRKLENQDITYEEWKKGHKKTKTGETKPVTPELPSVFDKYKDNFKNGTDFNAVVGQIKRLNGETGRKEFFDIITSSAENDSMSISEKIMARSQYWNEYKAGNVRNDRLDAFFKRLFAKDNKGNDTATIKSASKLDDEVVKKLKKAFGKDAEGFIELIEKQPEMAKLYNKYIPSAKFRAPEMVIGKGSKKVKERCHYDLARNTIVAEVKEIGNTHVRDYSTVAHECGHLFDRNGYRDTTVVRNKADIYESVHCFIGDNISTSDAFIDALKKDKEAIQKNLETVIADVNSYGDDSKGVQDALDGMFGLQDKGRVRWGHGNKYYDRMFNKYLQPEQMHDLLDYFTRNEIKEDLRNFETASELWANISSAQVVQGKALEVMKKYLPNCVNVYAKTIKEIV